MRSRLSTRLFSLFAILALVLAACGNDDAAPEDSDEPDGDSAAIVSSEEEDELPLVVVTTSILGDIVSTLVGDDAEVEVLMPIGADPHDFELSARQAAGLRDAEVVVANGLDLEIGLLGALDAAVDDGATLIEVGELLADPLPFGGHAHDDDDHGHEDDDHGHSHDDDHGHGDYDPHFWHDPVRTAEVLPVFAEQLAEALPALDAEELSERTEALADDLVALDAELAEIFAEVPEDRRYLITNHDSFGYLADRYGFEVIGVVIPGGDTLASPSPGDLAGLVHEIEGHDLPAIFAENIVAATLAEALADEAAIDVEVVSLYTDSLGEAGSGAETYPDMLRTNAGLIADALG